MSREQSLGRDPLSRHPANWKPNGMDFLTLTLEREGDFLITDKELLFRFASDKSARPMAWPLTFSRLILPPCRRGACAFPLPGLRATDLPALGSPVLSLSSTPPLSLENSFAS